MKQIVETTDELQDPDESATAAEVALSETEDLTTDGAEVSVMKSGGGIIR